jgi:hypothetical protein
MLLALVLNLLSSGLLSQAVGYITILIATGLSGLFLLALAGLSHPPTSSRWLILVACLGGLAARSVVWIQTARPPDYVVTDSAIYTEMAGELLRRGENPYTWDLTGASDLYNDFPIAVTPKLNASDESVYPYPALPFLLTVPLQSLDLPATLLISIAAHVAALILLFTASPRGFQPLILLPVIVMDFIAITLIGSMDIVWATLLIGIVLAWHKPRLRATLFGVAASIKQGPWLLLPFLIIRIWRDRKCDTPAINVGRFLTISGLTFLLINSPFITWNPEAWLHGVMEPLHDDLIFLSHGALSSLSQFGFASLPKSYYLLATLSVLGLLVFAYWRHYDVLVHTFWIMPGVFMWFSYRSLASYWIYWLFPILATLATETAWFHGSLESEKVKTTERSSRSRDSGAESSWLTSGSPGDLTLIVITITLGALLLIGLSQALSPKALEVVPILPLPTTNGRVMRMNVKVINHGHHTIAPRFAIQNRQTGENPLPWHIDHGPHTLSPGESATYHISATQHQPTFLAQEASQLIVTDAGGNYAYRDVSTIGPDRSYLWPDAIPNPTYRFWDERQTTPIFWNLTSKPTNVGTLSMMEREGRGTLVFTLSPTIDTLNTMRLRTPIIFPREPFGIWVYSDPAHSGRDLSTVAWGLEIDDKDHRLWFLFGSENCDVTLEEETFIVRRTVPPGSWTYQEIDVAGAYAAAGWTLPAFRPTYHRGLEANLRLVELSLFLIADDFEGRKPVRVYFGPIEQDYQLSPQILMKETFSDPSTHYLRLADSYLRSRNAAKAGEAYRQAQQFSPEGEEIPDEFSQMLQRNSERSTYGRPNH